MEALIVFCVWIGMVLQEMAWFELFAGWLAIWMS
jgi:hypothetical protein